MRIHSLILILIITNLVGCGGQSSNPRTDWYHPPPSIDWHWRLQGSADPEYDVALYDIDLFETPQRTIDRLHAHGGKVICYFSAGSWESWRPDATAFPQSALGKKLKNAEDERWLDIRNSQVRQIMRQRLDLALSKGCDGVEPDNVDGYVNETGFALTAKDQLNYNRFLAKEAHQRHLSIALKNDLGQINQLVGDFDFALNEQCHEFNECDRYAPFIQAGKAVLNAEYADIYRQNTDARNALCADARTRHFSTLILPVALDDSYRDSCAKP